MKEHFCRCFVTWCEVLDPKVHEKLKCPSCSACLFHHMGPWPFVTRVMRQCDGPLAEELVKILSDD